MDDNADRVHLPGQQPMPERDIEPLWPPEPTDHGPDGSAPAWAATAAHLPVPNPAVPNPADPGPPPADAGPSFVAPDAYPSLGAAPSTYARYQPVPGPVDLNLPFTLDPQTSAGAPPVPGDATAAGPVPVAPGVTTVGDAGAARGGSVAVPTSNGGGRVAESPWALPPQRPGGGTRPAGEPEPTVDVGSTRQPDAQEWARPADGAPRPAPPPAAVDAAAQPVDAAPRPVEAAGPQPPGPFPPVMNPPGPLAPTPYPPAVAGPVDAYTAGPVDAYTAGPVDAYTAGPVDAYTAGPVDAYTGGYPATAGETEVGWGPGPQQHSGPDTAPPAPTHPDQAHAGAVQPGWYPPGWPPQPPQQVAPQQVTPVPQPPYREADGVTRVPPGYPEPAWTPDTRIAPTAEDFARRRQVRPADPVATMGVRAVVNKTGLIKLPPGRHEQELRRDIEMVRRNFGGLRQVTVVNPKGGAGKTVAILLLAMTFGQKRGGYVLAWDNNETQGTLGMRAQQDFHSRTVRDMLRDLGQFQGAHGRVGDLSQYVRSQGEGMFDVLASDESATGGEMLTASAFAEIREVVSRFYKLIFVDTGNNVRAQNWQAAMDATDQLVVTMSARNDSAETAARMLDHLEQSGRQRLVRQAVTVVSMPPSRKEIDLPAIQEHFAARTRAVLLAPYERLIDTGEPIRYGQLSSATRDAWLKIAASVAEGL
ncbi:chromosome partitioning protein [Micromonospora sp. KC207]|uniref:chromosome partitioning protein n=1 Tax=Micromonospora sp. KC207 TaxID=2530377 RepID=UPI002694DE47